MRWATPVPVLSHEMIVRYLALRRARRIGMLWSDAGAYSIAELGHDHGVRNAISVARLIVLIEQAENELQRREAGRAEDYEATEDECAA